ncbi:MAG: AraC family transcriptional regulator [Firmicutes bacterium]|nr:AraC family transcriptional regulator [Bacillota bacterium]
MSAQHASRGAYFRYASAYPSIACHGAGYASEQDYLYINSAGIYMKDCPKNIYSHGDGRKDYYLAYHYGGHMFLTIDGVRHEVKPGDLFLLYPGQPHTYWYIDDGKIQNYWIHFTGYAARSIVEIFRSQGQQIISIGKYLENNAFFNRIIDELEMKNSGFQMMCVGHFLQLIATLIRQMQNTDKTAQCNQAIVRSIQYIRDNYKEKILITDLAKEASMNVKRFTAEFSAYTGTLPKQYIVMYRIEQAIGLITSQNISMSQAAEMVGFDNQMYFSRIFKRHMNMTPSQYKKKYTGR